MSRGFAGGLLVGGVVAVLGLGVLSQVAPPPAPQGAEPVAPEPSESGPSATLPGADSGAAPSTLPQADAAGLPPVMPVAEPPGQILPDQAAAAGTGAPDVTPGTDSPGDAGTVIPAPGPVVSPGEEAAPPPAELPPPPPLTPEEEALLAQISPEGNEVPPAEIEPADPEPAPETAPGTEIAAAGAPPEAAPAETPADPDAAPAPAEDAGTSESETGESQPQGTEPPPAVRVPAAPLPPAGGRLPRIGDATPETAEPGLDETALPEADAPPLRRYARPFDNAEGRPAFAILLVDTGGPALDREQLAALPFPVTFVIDPQAPDAQAAAAIYRAAGQEVAMLATGIPAGATAGDLEQTFQANADALPEAVAVADLPAGGFQDNRPLATQVVAVIGAEGRGLVTFDRGLNAADQVARREDVPAAVIFRRLDGEGEAAAVIRRYLDRAAFKAAQEGRVAVWGETRAGTVTALLEWSVEGRAAQVALAPLTAVLSTD